MSASPNSWPQLDDDTLLELAGDGAFSRAKKFAQERRAKVEEASSQQISGSVRGAARYDVALLLEGDSLQGVCNCPAAADGDFCKHQTTWDQARKRKPAVLRDVSERLEILLHEKNVDEAVAIARQNVASGQLVLMLADQARRAYPEISTPIYRRENEHWAGICGNRNYDQAIAFLNKLLPLMSVGDRRSYLADLRLRFKAKRNFIKLLESL